MSASHFCALGRLGTAAGMTHTQASQMGTREHNTWNRTRRRMRRRFEVTHEITHPHRGNEEARVGEEIARAASEALGEMHVSVDVCFDAVDICDVCFEVFILHCQRLICDRVYDFNESCLRRRSRKSWRKNTNGWKRSRSMKGKVKRRTSQIRLKGWKS